MVHARDVRFRHAGEARALGRLGVVDEGREDRVVGLEAPRGAAVGAVDEEDGAVGQVDAVGHGLWAVGQVVVGLPGRVLGVRADGVAVVEGLRVGDVAAGAAAEEDGGVVGRGFEGEEDGGGGGGEAARLEGRVGEGLDELVVVVVPDYGLVAGDGEDFAGGAGVGEEVDWTGRVSLACDSSLHWETYEWGRGCMTCSAGCSALL